MKAKEEQLQKERFRKKYLQCKKGRRGLKSTENTTREEWLHFSTTAQSTT